MALSDIKLKLDRITAGLDTSNILQQLTLSSFYDKIVQHIPTRKTRRTYEFYLPPEMKKRVIIKLVTEKSINKNFLIQFYYAFMSRNPYTNK